MLSLLQTCEPIQKGVVSLDFAAQCWEHLREGEKKQKRRVIIEGRGRRSRREEWIKQLLRGGGEEVEEWIK